MSEVAKLSLWVTVLCLLLLTWALSPPLGWVSGLQEDRALPCAVPLFLCYSGQVGQGIERPAFPLILCIQLHRGE